RRSAHKPRPADDYAAVPRRAGRRLATADRFSGTNEFHCVPLEHRSKPTRTLGQVNAEVLNVAQTCSLPYRGFIIRRALERLKFCRLRVGDTAQPGEDATKGARVCDPQTLCRPPSVLTNPARRSLSTCCGSQSRAPQNRRGPRRWGQILID